VRTILAENAHPRGSRTRAAMPTLLKGLIIGPDGKAMAPSHTRRRGRQGLQLRASREPQAA
jgi:site-specific DNA recombinase